jgi:hypothetical protein
MLKKSKKGMVVTSKEHAEWHRKNGGCGNAKEHADCMKKWGIVIRKKK